MLSKILKYYHTVKYLQPVQIYGRVYSKLKSKLKINPLPDVPPHLEIKINSRVQFPNHDPWNTQEGLTAGKFIFLNEEKVLGFPPNWHYADASLLWKFNLHYFNYMFLLDDGQKEKLCLDWIRKNPAGAGTGWNPYVISLRIVNWCKDGSRNEEIKKSIYAQAAYLYRNLEIYFPGNHLLENAKALIFAGLYFSSQGEVPKWLKKGIEIFEKELPIQTLPDGVYFELSPMYHAIMLEGFLDIINIMPDEYALRDKLITACKKMADFQVSATHPDGKIALLNDSTQEIALDSSRLLSYAQALLNVKPRSGINFPNTGYYIYRNDDIYLIADCGKIGPDYLPAHSHADIFNYELSIKGKKVITDSGVYEYAAGEMRKYNRSTKAHNTVSIDDADQAECWGSFRVARRYNPEIKIVKHSLSQDHKMDFLFEGQFDGYSKLIGDNINHTRKIEISQSKREISVRDYIDGKGIHSVKSYIHLVPETLIEKAGNKYYAETDGVKFTIEVLSGTPEIREGFYSPCFNIKLKSSVIVIIEEKQLPSLIHYKIRF